MLEEKELEKLLRRNYPSIERVRYRYVEEEGVGYLALRLYDFALNFMDLIDDVSVELEMGVEKLFIDPDNGEVVMVLE